MVVKGIKYVGYEAERKTIEVLKYDLYVQRVTEVDESEHANQLQGLHDLPHLRLPVLGEVHQRHERGRKCEHKDDDTQSGGELPLLGRVEDVVVQRELLDLQGIRLSCAVIGITHQCPIEHVHNLPWSGE